MRSCCVVGSRFVVGQVKRPDRVVGIRDMARSDGRKWMGRINWKSEIRKSVEIIYFGSDLLIR